MPVGVKDACLEIYQKLYKWHTNELEELEDRLSQTQNQDSRKVIEIVQKRLIVERKRIRKIYPDEFTEDEYDAIFGTPTK